jgi:hypothetical protein
MHQCLPCSEKESVSSRLNNGCPPATPRSISVLGHIRHDMQEYYDPRQGSSRRKLPVKIIKSPLLSKRKIEGLTLTKFHDQGLHNLAMLEEVLIGI